MRTIDADALTASLKESADRCRDWIQECINIKDDVTQRLAEQSLLTFSECYLRIKKMPTVEPQRMRGKWVKLYEGNYKCSECGDWWGNDDNDMVENFHYCPNCGAWMEGAEDDA